MDKGQTTIVGFILITAIAVVVISFALFFSIPLIEKTRNAQEVQRIEQRFLDLHEAIKTVAEEGEGSRRSIPFDISRGTIVLDADNNTIIYTGQFELNAPPARRKLIFGNNTRVGGKPVVGFPAPTEVAEKGTEEPAFFIEQGSIELFLHYRILKDVSTNECVRIKLVPGEQAAAGVGRHNIILTGLAQNTTVIVGSGCLPNNETTDKVVEFNIR